MTPEQLDAAKSAVQTFATNYRKTWTPEQIDGMVSAVAAQVDGHAGGTPVQALTTYAAAHGVTFSSPSAVGDEPQYVANEITNAFAAAA